MKMVKILFYSAVFVISLFTLFAEAEYYKYRDKNGVLRFTDNLVEVPEDQRPNTLKETTEPEVSEDVTPYLREGSAAYLMQDFKKAIQSYSKVLELEKMKPTLDKNTWRVVVDNLGMSYGISGNNIKAKEIFEYGLSKDNEYPMFYYNLACAYAEMNDLDNTIINLKEAFKYKKNMIPGEQFPNPAADNSFFRFMNNEKFRQTLNELSSE